ncbi:MAG: Holliday junction branch migration protein RuvA [Kiloniellales bacterium]
MIGKLTGTVDSTGEDWAILDVGGVGYLVSCSARTLAALPESGRPVSLHVETRLGEEQLRLFGFAEGAERDWFRLLDKVQGVGARLALAILSVLSPEQLIQAIASEDKAALTRANGVGPKLAQRLISELKEKAGRIALGQAARLAGAEKATATPVNGASLDAVSALVNLGYGRSEAFGAIGKAARELGPAAGLDTLIRAGLKELAS